MWVVLYMVAIVLVNRLFIDVPFIASPLGNLHIANVIVGFIFVLRDYAQREVGHRVLLFTALAGAATYVMATPEIAIASITAFALSEMADWGVYSFTRRPLQQRILWSSLIAVPLDTLVFQHMAGYLTTAAFATEVLSKALGVFLVWQLLRARAATQTT
ncbi:MAG TPA: VUT family protein [Aestuariivirga sp.]|nr:VUT family protein [Aestuariivirga sp.]